MRYLVLLSLLFVSPCFASNPLAQARCTILFSFKGEVAEQFNKQQESLQHHLSSKDIRLLDLNNWAQTKLSGRQRNLLRQKYALIRSGNHAVVFDRRGKIIMDISQHIDLVDILMHCPK